MCRGKSLARRDPTLAVPLSVGWNNETRYRSRPPTPMPACVARGAAAPVDVPASSSHQAGTDATEPRPQDGPPPAFQRTVRRSLQGLPGSGQALRPRLVKRFAFPDTQDPQSTPGRLDRAELVRQQTILAASLMSRLPVLRCNARRVRPRGILLSLCATVGIRPVRRSREDSDRSAVPCARLDATTAPKALDPAPAIRAGRVSVL